MIKVQGLINYANAALGGGYCYGASGELCSPQRRREFAEWNPSQEKNLLGICEKWDGMPVWDCSGLFRGAWRKLLKYRSGGATTQYREWCDRKGTIDTMPEVPGIAVFWGDGVSLSHVGIYIGGGQIVEAQGSATGVVQTTVASRKPTHWGAFADVDYGAAGSKIPREPAHYTAVIKTRTGGGVFLWNNPQKERSLAPVPDGENVEVLGRPVLGSVAPCAAKGFVGYIDTQYCVNRVELTTETPEPEAPIPEDAPYIKITAANLVELLAALQGAQIVDNDKEDVA
jgi:hypothetical protein